MQYVPDDLDPVVEKYCLHLRYHWAFYLKVRIAPGFRILPLAAPLRGDAYASGEGHAAVNHE